MPGLEIGFSGIAVATVTLPAPVASTDDDAEEPHEGDQEQ